MVQGKSLGDVCSVRQLRWIDSGHSGIDRRQGDVGCHRSISSPSTSSTPVEAVGGVSMVVPVHGRCQPEPGKPWLRSGVLSVPHTTSRSSRRMLDEAGPRSVSTRAGQVLAEGPLRLASSVEMVGGGCLMRPVRGHCRPELAELWPRSGVLDARQAALRRSQRMLVKPVRSRCLRRPPVRRSGQ